MPVTSYVVHMHIHYLCMPLNDAPYMACMCNLVGNFFGTHMTIASQVDIAVSCILVHISLLSGMLMQSILC